MNGKISKKDYSKKKLGKEECHMEGKYACDCRIRNFRAWLGKKRGLKKEEE